MGENRGKKPTEKTKMMLCAASAGRCEFEGCNKYLFEEESSCEPLNLSEVAHNIASSPDGPRGSIELSHDLSSDIENLLLLCREHHKLVDDKPEIYTVQKLREMKIKHESEIQRLCDLMYYPKCIVVRLQSPIKGKAPVIINQKEINSVVAKNFRPQEKYGPLIEVELTQEYSSKEFWHEATKKIENEYARKILPLLENKDIDHIAIFSLAPIPMIIQLGYLISDKIQAHTYQKSRSRNSWEWVDDTPEVEFLVKKTKRQVNVSKVALVLSISAEIPASRVPDDEDVLYNIYVRNPNVEAIRGENDLRSFRSKYMSVLDQIKKDYPKINIVDIFCAIPTSIAFEVGKSYMEGTYPRIRIFDYQDNFFETITIGGK